MSRELVIGVVCGLIAGAWLSLATSPRTAIAQSIAGTPGLYQIQIASGMAQAGTSPIWRVNAATGALDFCTFTNVNLSGGSRISCVARSDPQLPRRSDRRRSLRARRRQPTGGCVKTGPG